MSASSYMRDNAVVTHAEFVTCALNPAHSVTVEACAGSGKTWLLVGRMLRLLLAGAAPGSILAITFTRKAAQEMQQRLHTLLQTLAVCPDAQALVLLQERGLSASAARAQLQTARLLYEAVLMAQPPLKVDTFHGWFWQILQRAPLRLDGAPHYSVDDPNTWGQALPISPNARLLEHSERLENEAWQGFLQRATKSPSLRANYLKVLEDCGTSAQKMLRSLLRQRAEWWAFAEPHAQPITAALAAVWPEFTAADSGIDPRANWHTPIALDWCRTIARSVPDNSTTSDTVRKLATECERALADHTDGITDGLDSFANLQATVLTGELNILKNLLNPKQLKNLGPAQTAYYEAVHSLAAHLRMLIEQHSDWCAWQLNCAAWPCALAWLDEYQQRKAQRQMIDFADIEWHTRQLLRDERYAAYMQMRLDARYQHILFDEFQDTNPLQWGIVQSWLNAYGDDAARPSVFIVGDPKQSIYRFRRADPRLFATARDWLQTHFAAQTLRTNHTWRNAQAVVTQVNQIFNALPEAQRPQNFAAQTTEYQQVAGLSGVYCSPPMTADEAEKVIALDDKSPALRNPLQDPPQTAEDARRAREADALVKLLGNALPQLRIGHADKTRPANYGDAMILVRTRTHLQVYEQALLAANIPFISDRRGGLLTTPEASDLNALLRFLTDPHDDLALAQVLCSPLFAGHLQAHFGDTSTALNQLARAQASTWWQALRGLAAHEPVWQDCATLLNDWQEHAGRRPVHDLLDRIYHQAEVVKRYSARTPLPRLAQMQGNLREFLALALKLDGGRFLSLPRFLQELDELERASAQEAPDEANPDGAQMIAGACVRLLTVHAAKGLEAPLVFLPDADYQPSERGYNLLFDWPAGALAPTEVSFVGRVRELGACRAALWEREEALARREAQNLLYVALTRAQNVVLVTAVKNLNKKANSSSWHAQIAAVSPTPPDTLCALPASPLADDLPSRVLDVSRSFDELAPLVLTPPPETCTLPEISIEQCLGLAWHALLQKIYWTEQGAAVLDALLSGVLARFGLLENHASTLRTAVERVLLAPALQPFFSRSAFRIQTELDVITADGSRVRLDRLVELPNAFWLLDYKWQVSPAQLPTYQMQLARYAVALRAIFPNKPLHCGLITATGELIVMEGVCSPPALT